DVVVEANIVRAAVATATPRPPAAADTLSRAVTLGDGAWPLQSEPVPPSPAAPPLPPRPHRSPPPPQLAAENGHRHAEPEPGPPPAAPRAPAAARAETRPGAGGAGPPPPAGAPHPRGRPADPRRRPARGVCSRTVAQPAAGARPAGAAAACAARTPA